MDNKRMAASIMDTLGAKLIEAQNATWLCEAHAKSTRQHITAGHINAGILRECLEQEEAEIVLAKKRESDCEAIAAFARLRFAADLEGGDGN